MELVKLLVACLCLSAALPNGHCGTVLSMIMPGPLSHLFGMKKVAEAVAARGHTVKVIQISREGLCISVMADDGTGATDAAPCPEFT